MVFEAQFGKTQAQVLGKLTGPVYATHTNIGVLHTHTWPSPQRLPLGSAQSPTFLGVGALTDSIPQCSASVRIRCRNGCLDMLPTNTIHRSLFLRPRSPKALALGSEAESHITDLRVLFLTLETEVLETSLSHLTHVHCSSFKWTHVYNLKDSVKWVILCRRKVLWIIKIITISLSGWF